MKAQMQTTRRNGVAAVIAMLFLALISTLAVALIGLTRTNTQIAMNQTNVEQARISAEAGLRWIAWKFATVQLPQSTIGTIDNSAAQTLWGTSTSPSQGTILYNLLNDSSYGLSKMSTSVLKTKEVIPDANGHMQLHAIVSVPAPYRMDFEILATSGPAAPSYAPSAQSYTDKAQVIAVQSRGIIWVNPNDANNTPTDQSKVLVTRTIKCYFLMQKTFRYCVLSRIPIQLGKNTVVEGDLYYALGVKDRTGKSDHQPPLLSISDFRYTSGNPNGDPLTTNINSFQTFLSNNAANDLDNNRIPVSDSRAAASGWSDVSGDGYVDEYDIFLSYFDKNASKSVSLTEFQNGAPTDLNLFYLIDQWIGEPHPGTQQTDPLAANYEAARLGLNDSVLNANDPYAKVTGQVRIWEQKSDLAGLFQTWGQSQTIRNQMQGPIISPDGYTAPVVWGQSVYATTDPATQITPASFTQSAYLGMAGTSGGTSVTPTKNPLTSNTIPEPCGSAVMATAVDTSGNPLWPLSGREYANTTVDLTKIVNGTLDQTVINDLNATDGTSKVTSSSTAVTIYQRDPNTGAVLTDSKGNPLTTTAKPVIQVVESIPYGATNPRGTVTRPVISGCNFRNCVIKRGGNALFVNCRFDGVTFVDGDMTMAASGNADDKKGNNFRFVGCTFTGPLVQGDANNSGATPTNYGDCSNSWEFMGTTTIDLRQPSDGGIGSWDKTADSSALVTLKQQATIQAPQTNIEMGSFTNPGANQCSFQGIVVAGCFDVRGKADIDGSIVVLNKNAGNCTLGYFGPDDSAGNQGQPDPNMQKTGASYGRIHIRFNAKRTLPNGINLNVSIYPDMKSMEEVTQWESQ